MTQPLQDSFDRPNAGDQHWLDWKQTLSALCELQGHQVSLRFQENSNQLAAPGTDQFAPSRFAARGRLRGGFALGDPLILDFETGAIELPTHRFVRGLRCVNGYAESDELLLSLELTFTHGFTVRLDQLGEVDCAALGADLLDDVHDRRLTPYSY